MDPPWLSRSTQRLAGVQTSPISLIDWQHFRMISLTLVVAGIESANRPEPGLHVSRRRDAS
jgi:hypothetical protein